MRDHTNSIRGYIRSSKAWYAKNLQTEDIEIMIGMYDPKGGTSGEFSISWTSLSSKNKTLVPILNCYDDGWSALFLFKDLLEEMAKVDDENISESNFCKILDNLDIKDMTPYKEPIKIRNKYELIYA